MITLRSAELLRFAGHAVLELETPEGLAYLDSPKLLFLANRFVILWGPDVEEGRVPTETVALPMDPTDGRWTAMDFRFATRDPVVVHLAGLMVLGELENGPVRIPSLQEVEEVVWEVGPQSIAKKHA